MVSQDFHGDQPSRRQLPCFEDLSERAVAEHAEHSIARVELEAAVGAVDGVCVCVCVDVSVDVSDGCE